VLLDCLDSGGVRVATLALLDGVLQMHDQIFLDSMYTFAWYTRSRNLSNTDTARSFEVELAPHTVYMRRKTTTAGVFDSTCNGVDMSLEEWIRTRALFLDPFEAAAGLAQVCREANDAAYTRFNEDVAELDRLLFEDVPFGRVASPSASSSPGYSPPPPPSPDYSSVDEDSPPPNAPATPEVTELETYSPLSDDAIEADEGDNPGDDTATRRDNVVVTEPSSSVGDAASELSRGEQGTSRLDAFVFSDDDEDSVGSHETWMQHHRVVRNRPPDYRLWLAANSKCGRALRDRGKSPTRVVSNMTSPNTISAD
jgi:hypothetical protein